ncbi:phage scaffolding protein [Paenibacillus elgii]|uniref:phage scaffolding protein n=1 Tax=Paenibacillus elgii TaxID=189691 RepID=UPI00203B559D|nr:phage scaffolding protein [Paenibacillus elgii]MCM3273668.1 phage scaffolding protein [Paenibacillus elgii]
MEWLKKLSESQGLSAEQIKAIVSGVEENYQGYVPKHRFDEVNEAKKKLESEMKDRDKQLAELKKSAGDNEELTKQIEQLQTENKAAAEKHEAAMTELRMSAAVKLALTGEVHDPDIVTNLLDKSKIELGEDGGVKAGLDEQVKALRESKAFLFVQKQEGQKQPLFKGFTPVDGTQQQGQETTMQQIIEKNILGGQ